MEFAGKEFDVVRGRGHQGRHRANSVVTVANGECPSARYGRRAHLELGVPRPGPQRTQIELVGAPRIDFAGFAVCPPSVAELVRVEDHGILEFRRVFTPSD